MFQEAQIEVFTEKHILNIFEKTSIWPQDLDKVLKTIHKLTLYLQLSTLLQNQFKILKTVHTICHIYLAYQKDPQTPLKQKILYANIELAAQVVI